MMMEDATDPLH